MIYFHGRKQIGENPCLLYMANFGRSNKNFTNFRRVVLFKFSSLSNTKQEKGARDLAWKEVAAECGRHGKF